MRLTDIVSSLGLTFFPIIGMLLFLSVFVGVLVRVCAKRHRAELDRAAFLPLGDEHVAPRSTPSQESTR